jgi:hypothetical protein
MSASTPITFNYSDNWLCYAFFVPTKPGVAVNLKDVIGFGDFIDHSIITYDEITTSLTKLLQTDVIVRKDETYCTSDGFNKLWSQRLTAQKKKSISKEVAELQAFLNTHFTSVILRDIPELIISEQAFRFAVDAYLKK